MARRGRTRRRQIEDPFQGLFFDIICSMKIDLLAKNLLLSPYFLDVAVLILVSRADLRSWVYSIQGDVIKMNHEVLLMYNLVMNIIILSMCPQVMLARAVFVSL